MPSVNTMIVDRADMLGLGQLHQLRGRVGRGGQRAYAYLFHPAAKSLSETAYERLRTIGDNAALGSGFKIAMRDLEIRGAGSLLGHDQSGHVAAVGYDLYVQMVAEAVAGAKGERYVEPTTITLDVPGDAHLPGDYVANEDDRLEIYRRLSVAQSTADLEDMADEWRDRYGDIPAPARRLLELTALKLLCRERGIMSLQVAPPRPGLRAAPVASLSPVSLSLSKQTRAQRLYGSQAYDGEKRSLRVSLAAGEPIEQLRAIIEEMLPAAEASVG
jgi:transcription-repair coupling factor (superfamily II helicase)